MQRKQQQQDHIYRQQGPKDQGPQRPASARGAHAHFEQCGAALPLPLGFGLLERIQYE
jgi:hypothetical protein